MRKSFFKKTGEEERMCGIFGCQGSSQAAVYVQLGLHGNQHRGQESAGIVSADGREF